MKDINKPILDTSALRVAIEKEYSNIEDNGSLNFDYVQSILQAALTLKDTSQFFRFNRSVLIRYYVNREINEEAILFLTLSKKMLGGNDNSYAELDNAIGNFYARMEFNEEALEHYYKSISWYEKHAPEDVTIPMGNLADIYFKNKEYEKALKYNEEALGYSLRLEDKDDRLNNLLHDYMRIGFIYYYLGRSKEAEDYVEKALEANREFDSNSLLLLHGISDAIEICSELGNIEKCNKLIQEGEAICSDNQKYQSRSGTYFEFQKSKYYLKQGLIDLAKTPEWFDSRNSGFDNEIYLYSTKYYARNKDFGKAMERYDKALEFYETRTIEKRKIAYSSIEEKYANIKLTQENKKLTEASEKRKIYTLGILFTLFLLSCLLILQSLNSRRYKKLNSVLQNQTKDLERTNTKLASTNEELERFTFIASHDLKTPLRNIVSFTDLLGRKLEASEDKNVHKYLGVIKEGGLRLDSLISETLEYSKFSSKEFLIEKESIDLNKLLDKVRKSISHYVSDKNAEIINLGDLPKINSHYHSVYTLFQNIILNGIKYNGSENPLVEVSANESESYYSIFIKDNGIGIGKEYQDKVFTMFFRLHNHAEYSGSGLGLAICKKIIERLNGEIQLKSTVGEGSIFEIKLLK